MAGIDGICLEHFIYSHVSLVDHLTSLFNMILLHGYVPRNFGTGIIIPILKDRHGDASILENYRGITLSTILSKVLEVCIKGKLSQFLVTNDVQFGFKKGHGCHHAVYMVQNVVDYFRKRGSTVFIATLDASKAFDRVDHGCLFSKLIERGVPRCLAAVLYEWYGKLSSVVRWYDYVSKSFEVKAGVRQGGILSPILFNVYMDDLTYVLRVDGHGCFINRTFLGCIMYADDILLLSASVGGL